MWTRSYFDVCGLICWTVIMLCQLHLRNGRIIHKEKDCFYNWFQSNQVRTTTLRKAIAVVCTAGEEQEYRSCSYMIRDVCKDRGIWIAEVLKSAAATEQDQWFVQAENKHSTILWKVDTKWHIWTAFTYIRVSFILCRSRLQVSCNTN